MKYCEKCGSAIQQDCEFCPNCGNQINKTESKGPTINNMSGDYIQAGANSKISIKKVVKNVNKFVIGFAVFSFSISVISVSGFVAYNVFTNGDEIVPAVINFLTNKDSNKSDKNTGAGDKITENSTADLDENNINENVHGDIPDGTYTAVDLPPGIDASMMTKFGIEGNKIIMFMTDGTAAEYYYKVENGYIKMFEDDGGASINLPYNESENSFVYGGIKYIMQ